MKDHEIAQLVNALRDCAVEFHSAQQLRERIAALVVPALRGERSPKMPAWSDELSVTLNVLAGKREELRAANDQLVDWDKLFTAVVSPSLPGAPSLWPFNGGQGPAMVAFAIHQLREELRVTDQLLAERDRLLKAIPECPSHGDGCVPSAIEWVERQKILERDSLAWLAELRDSPSYDQETNDVIVRLETILSLQQSSSGITAGAESASQVVDFGAAGPIRTGDLLITNQSAKAPETSQNQDVTPKTAPTQPVEVVPAESSGCEGVTAGEARAEYIEVCADVRYWEDASVNGTDDDNGTLIPFRNGDAWCPVIRLADGMVMDWPQGMTAHIHYKVCDAGEYWLLDSGRQRTAKWGGYYVPNDFLCHGDSGYGDYIIFKVGADGVIANWCSPAVEMARGGDEESHHKWVALIKDGTP